MPPPYYNMYDWTTRSADKGSTLKFATEHKVNYSFGDCRAFIQNRGDSFPSLYISTSIIII